MTIACLPEHISANKQRTIAEELIYHGTVASKRNTSSSISLDQCNSVQVAGPSIATKYEQRNCYLPDSSTRLPRGR